MIDRATPRVDALIEELAQAEHGAVGHAIDVCDRPKMSALLDAEARVDVMVYSASIGPCPALRTNIRDEEFRNVLDVNVLRVFIASQEAVHRMKPGGRIVTVSSRAALGVANFAHYVASKAAMVGLTRAMAMDRRRWQIAVNSIAPGYRGALTP